MDGGGTHGYYYGQLLRSTDGGQQWQMLNSPAAKARSLILKIVLSPTFDTDESLFINLTDGTLWRSGDGGVSWAHINNGWDEKKIHDFTIVKAGKNITTLFAAVDTGLKISKDGGQTWSLLELPYPEKIAVSVDAAGRPTIFGIQSTDRLFRWTEGQETWINLLPQINNLKALTVQGQTIYTRNYSTLFESKDGGETWFIASSRQ
jgi:photosystem II stability/assembly factor-like uncharacterized protein